MKKDKSICKNCRQKLLKTLKIGIAKERQKAEKEKDKMLEEIIKETEKLAIGVYGSGDLILFLKSKRK